jgi:hypothetical protein
MFGATWAMRITGCILPLDIKLVDFFRRDQTVPTR